MSLRFLSGFASHFRAAVGLAACLLLACGTVAPTTAPAENDLQARLEAAIAYEMADKAMPGFSIALVEDQALIWARGFGLADPATGRPATAETVYRVASVSKLFTALAVMQLVEQGRLDLDVPVQAYLPDFRPQDPFGRPITLRHLLSHRSGLVREPPVGSYFDPGEPSLAATVASLNGTLIVYPPGERTKYSNAAVSVAGRIVEQVQGEPFEAYMQRAVLGPMGLSHSSFRPRPDLRRDLATGYMWTYDGRTFEAPVFELGIGPAANLYTTVTDLARFMGVLFAAGRTVSGEQVVQPATLDTMWTVQFAEADQPDGFGLGFYVSTFQGRRRVQHSGVMYGYATRLYALPDDRLGVAAVGTVDAANPVVDRLAEYALALRLAQREGRPLPDYPHTAPIDEHRRRQLAGRYEGPHWFELTEIGDELYLYTASERLRLRSRADTLLTDGRLGFGYRLLPRGSSLLTDAGTFEPISPPRPPPLPDALSELIGGYGWDHNTLYVLERDGRLWVLVEWFFFYPLEGAGPDRYRLPDYGLYAGEPVVFERDGRGNVSAVNFAGVRFERRDDGGNDPFRITPVRPVAALRAEALAAAPPAEEGNFSAPDLVDLARLDTTFRLDIRYATADNFMGMPFYETPRAFLQRPAAEALVRAQAALRRDGLGLILYDAYRPWHVTKMFWDATPDALRDYVADPARGSRHNRGAAVDVGLYDLATDRPVEMPSGYDEFTPRAHADFPGGTARARWHRARLRAAMEAEGFTVYAFEWWHFDYAGWRAYPILNEPFEALDAAR